MDVLSGGKRLAEVTYRLEQEFEADIVANYERLFAPKGLYIDAKKKVGTKSLGGTIPDGFFIDLSDPDSPEFYLVEVELAAHSFFGHIFPQITKFFSFYKNQTSLNALIETIYTLINGDPALKRRIKKLIGKQEVFKFLSDLLNNSQNILLVIDGEKRELAEIMETYTDTWGRYVKHLTVRKFVTDGEAVFVVDPSFSDIPYVVQEGEVESLEPPSEADHLSRVNPETRELYAALRAKLSACYPDLIFNPQKYYVSIKAEKNIAYFKFRKSKLRLIMMRPEQEIRSGLTHYKVIPLSQSVQNFYSGPCAAIDLTDGVHWMRWSGC